MTVNHYSLNDLPTEIINKIIYLTLEFNKAFELDVCKFLTSFDELILENINTIYLNVSKKYNRNTKIITKYYQPEEAHHIPMCNDLLYWKHFIINFDTNSDFIIKRNYNDFNELSFYKNELQNYYYLMANNKQYVP